MPKVQTLPRAMKQKLRMLQRNPGWFMAGSLVFPIQPKQPVLVFSAQVRPPGFTTILGEWQYFTNSKCFCGHFFEGLQLIKNT